jgi:hypothetical protein
LIVFPTFVRQCIVDILLNWHNKTSSRNLGEERAKAMVLTTNKTHLNHARHSFLIRVQDIERVHDVPGSSAHFSIEYTYVWEIFGISMIAHTQGKPNYV